MKGFVVACLVVAIAGCGTSDGVVGACRFSRGRYATWPWFWDASPVDSCEPIRDFEIRPVLMTYEIRMGSH